MRAKTPLAAMLMLAWAGCPGPAASPPPAKDDLGRPALGPADAQRPARDWIRLLEQGERGERLLAAQALRQQGPAAAAAVPALGRALASADSELRAVAALALGAMGPAAAPAVPALLAAGQDPEPDVHGPAFWALGEIGPAAAPAVPELEKLLGYQQAGFRVLAARTLGRIGAPARGALPALRRLAAEDVDERVRQAAAEAIASLEQP